MIEKVVHKDEILAIIVRRSFNKPGIHFFTDPKLSQQLAFMKHPKGRVIDPHVHKPLKREVMYTQEVLLIKKGKLRVDFYDDNQNYLQSKILEKGDVILLTTGGHGFEILEESSFIEVKQGPYAGDDDKSKFEGIDNSDVLLN